MPINLTPRQARVIDPVLTEVAQGFTQAEFVGSALFPRVNVMQRGGNIITFGAEHLKTYQVNRAPGADTPRVSFGYAGASYVIPQSALDGAAPQEMVEEAVVPGIDIADETVSGVQLILGLNLEQRQAALARNAANYAGSNKITLSGTAQWSDYTGTSNPAQVVTTAIEAIRQQTGKRPNTMLLPAAVRSFLRMHPKVIEFFKSGPNGGQNVTNAMLAQFFDVENLVVADPIQASDSNVISDVWGKDVILAYTNTQAVKRRGTPSYGYTYTLDGCPYVSPPYWDDRAKTWLYPVVDEAQPVIASAISGYLIQAAVA